MQVGIVMEGMGVMGNECIKAEDDFTMQSNARRSPGIDSKELIPPAIAWRAAMATLFFLGS